jgi:hypothetical protein
MALKGLEGTSGEAVKAVFVTKVSKIEKALNEGKAVTCAGNNGALNIWKDDEGFIRCCFMRYQITLDERKYNNIKAAKLWFNKWFPQLEFAE